MADGVTITAAANATPPAGTVVSTDDAGAAGHVQRVKLAYSADASAVHVTADADGLLVNLGANNDVTVTGTVTANAGSGTLAISAASLPLPTGASTLAEQQTQTTALQLIDDAVHADAAARGKSLLIGAVLDDTATVAVAEDQAGYVRMSAARRLLVDPSGVTSPVSAASLPLPTGAATLAGQTQPGVDIGDVTVNNAAGASAVNVQDGGNSLTVDGTVAVSSLPALVAGAAKIGAVDTDADATIAAAVPTVGLFVAGTDGTNARALKTDAAGELQVDVLTLPALVAGAANIGDVDVLTVPAPLSTTGNGTAATALRVTLASDSTGTTAVTQATAASLNAQVVGNVAHDAAASGNPVMTAGSHETPADSAPTNRLATVTDGDVQRFSTIDGALYVIPSGPQQWKARLTGLIAADTTVKASPGAGLSLYITDIVFSIGAATASSIMLEESTTTPVFGPHYLEAVSGRGIGLHFGTPIKIAANTLLSATGTGSTTATLDVYGFTAPG